MEDRLNPIPAEGVDETTLGGYAAVHGRAAAFEGADGSAYTVAIEAEEVDGGPGEWVGYLVYLRWAAEGSAIMGHLETDDLARGASREAVVGEVESITLHRAKELLDATIERKRHWEGDGGDDADQSDMDEADPTEG
jgi:hypothetical protein